MKQFHVTPDDDKVCQNILSESVMFFVILNLVNPDLIIIMYITTHSFQHRPINPYPSEGHFKNVGDPVPRKLLSQLLFKLRTD
jgi:hypothetical protein